VQSLGIHVRTLTPEIAEANKLDVRSGAVITSIDRNSAAAREGLRPGDVITEVGAKSVKNAEDFAAAMKGQDLKKGVRLYVTSRDIGSRFVFLQSEK